MGTQVSTITQEFCEQYGYDIHPMKQMLCLEGMGRFSIPYLGYIEATVMIPPIKNYDEFIPILVLKSSLPFSSQVPVQLGPTVLDRAMAKIYVAELACASDTWQQTYMSTVVMARVASTVEQNMMTPPPLIPL